MQCEKRITDEIIAAVREGKVETLQQLINQYGTDWKERRNLLLLALQTKQLKIAELLLTQGWGFDITDFIIPLNLAVSHSDIKIIEMILERGADINSSYKGKTPLHVSVETGTYKTIEYLVNNGANVNGLCTSRGQEGYTSLHFAAMKGYKDIVNLLLIKGANVNATTENDETPLHTLNNKVNFFNKGEDEIVKLLLEKGADIHYKRKDKLSPLLFAVKTSNESVVKVLLEHGANVDDQDEDGNTALYLAVKTESLSIVKIILNYFPSFDIPSNRKSLIYAVSCGKRNHDIVKALLEYGFTLCLDDANNAQLFHNFISMGSSKVVEWFLKNGTNPNGLDCEGKTPLHTAVRSEYLSIVEDLLKYGANVNDKAKLRETSLHVAVKKINERVVKVLLEHGADVDDKDLFGDTALSIAVRTDCLPIVKNILKYFPNIGIMRNSGSLINVVRNYCSNLSTRRNCRYIVDALLEYGFSLCLDDASNVQLFHNAISMGSSKLVEWFLKNGANPNGLDCEGNTSLHTAAQNKNKEVGELLISYGADINAKNKNGKTVIIYAIEENNLELTKLLLSHGANINDFVKQLEITFFQFSKEIIEAILPYYCDISAILPITVLCSADVCEFDGNRAQIAKLLITKGANVDYRNEEKKTSLYYASLYGFPILVKTLLYYGADINAACGGFDFYHKTGSPLQIAWAVSRKFGYENKQDHYKEIVGILQRHILQLKIANLYVNEQNLVAMSWSYDEKNNDFEKECEKEISKMKNNKIRNTRITFYKILENYINIAKYMTYENILAILKLEDYKTEYPIYARMIELNFMKAMKRKELVAQTNLVFHTENKHNKKTIDSSNEIKRQKRMEEKIQAIKKKQKKVFKVIAIGMLMCIVCIYAHTKFG